MPSVDSVGRYFPVTLAVRLPTGTRPAEVPIAAAGWFAAAADLVTAALDDGCNIDEFDRQVQALGQPLPGLGSLVSPPGTDQAFPTPIDAWRLAIDPAAEPASAYPGLADRLMTALFDQYSLWWTTGSDRVEPSLLVCRNLPRPEAFAALLDGRWRRWEWNAEPPEPALSEDVP